MGSEDRRIALVEKNLKPVPAACPQCGEKEGWGQVRTVDPYDRNPTRKDNIIEGIFSEAGPLGGLIGALLPVRKKVTYRCKKCDFRGQYKAR